MTHGKRCDLCGEWVHRCHVASNDYVACNPCFAMLIENEVERRGVRAQEKAMEDGWSGDDRLRQEMAKARKLK